MTVKFAKLAALVALAGLAAGCGEFTREGRGPSVVVVRSLQAASGASPGNMGGSLLSDVRTDEGGTVNDIAEVVMSLVSKDPGIPGIFANPTFLNAVTMNRYHVAYLRADGRNVQGVDVPYAFDSGLTFTVPADGIATAGFQIVRNTAKLEAPLRALAFNGEFINTIAEVTFYGRDQAGNDVLATARIGIDFADFADPE